MKFGESRWKEGQFEEAMAWYTQAADLSRRIDDPEKTARCLNRLGRLCWAVGRPEESRKFWEEALAKLGEQSSAKDAAESRLALKVFEFYSRGKAERLAGQHEKALQSLGEAVKLAEELEAPEVEIKCLRQLSLVHWDRQDWTVYVDVNTRSLQIARELKDQREQARCMINLALHRYRTYSYQDALEWYSAALDISRRIKDRTIQSFCQKNMAIILMQLGYYERSLDHLFAAYEVDRAAENPTFTAQNLNNLAEAFRSKGLIFSTKEDLYSALDYFGQAREGAVRSGDRRTEVKILTNIGRLHIDLGKCHTAIHYLGLASGAAEATRDQESLIEITNNLGLCHLRLGQYERAEKLFLRALDLTGELDRNFFLWKSVFHLGECYEKRGAYEPALACYRKSIEAIEHIRSRIVSDEYKSGFVRDKMRVYESLISLLFSLDGGRSADTLREIFQVTERARARAFIETLENAKMGLRREPDENLSQKEAEISRLITAIIGELAKKNLSLKHKEELSEKLRQAEEEYIRMSSRLEPANIGYPEASPHPAGLEEVQRVLLDEKTAILEFFLGERRSYLFLISRNDFRLFALPARAEIEKSLSAYLELLSAPPKGKWKGHLAGQRLYRDLLREAISALPGSVEHLVIIPDGVLCALPFETLPLPATAGASNEQYLISRYAFSYAASCSTLLLLREKEISSPPAKGLLAFGDPEYPKASVSKRDQIINPASLTKSLYESHGFDLSPLERSRREVKSTAAFFPRGKRDVYVAKKAAEEILKKTALDDYEVIHFACHGYLDDRVPFRSGLFLSLHDGQKEDGFLQAREIARLRMRAGLVVLSACRSSGGYIEKGEGVMGLARSFFYAGARSVLSSLWEVSDRAAVELMREFYAQLGHRKNKAQALRLAKLRLLESKYDHPFYWAAFILHGEPFSGLNTLN